MSVLIRGMEMPDNCSQCDAEWEDENPYGGTLTFCCPFIYKGYTDDFRSERRHNDCPLVPGRTSPFVPECWAERVRKHLEEVGRMANNMKLEEAIAHLDESLNDQSHDWGCEECKQEHEQLRKWLIELKERRAAEVKPVVYSYWEKEPDGGYVCHECRQRPLLDGSEADALSDYCPNCGAKMEVQDG